jgi:hypothetical protein
MNNFITINISNCGYSTDKWFQNINITSNGDIIYYNIKITKDISENNPSLKRGEFELYDKTIYKIDLQELYSGQHTNNTNDYNITKCSQQINTCCTELMTLECYENKLICIGRNEIKVIDTKNNIDDAFIIKLSNQLTYNLKPYVMYDNYIYVLDIHTETTGHRLLRFMKYELSNGSFVDSIPICNNTSKYSGDLHYYNYVDVSLHVCYHKIILLFDTTLLLFDLKTQQIIWYSSEKLYKGKRRLGKSVINGRYLYVLHELEDLFMYKLIDDEYNVKIVDMLNIPRLARKDVCKWLANM